MGTGFGFISTAMEKMKTSFITTVYNEEDSIKEFLDSLFNQSKLPDEIIVVDGRSSDMTVAKIKSEKLKMKNYRGEFKLIQKKGNRAVGRNEAIRHATGSVIACSDAGCILDKDWFKNITKPFEKENIDVVAGYCSAITNSVFQKCLAPYVLVMPNRIKEDSFLPATRSLAFKKNVWKKVCGFDEKYSHNEDYVFAKQLKKIGARIVFQKNAIAYWFPRKNLQESFYMFFFFAVGDAEAGIFRPKVALIFIRYIIGLLLFVLFLMTKSLIIFDSLLIALFLYVIWAIVKNYKYVKNVQAFLYLPLLQLVSDISVITGSLLGLCNNIWDTKYMR